MLWAANLAYSQVLGKPLMFWSGITLGIIFLMTFLIPILNRRKITKIPMKLHFTFAWITLILVLFHGIIGIFIYL